VASSALSSPLDPQPCKAKWISVWRQVTSVSIAATFTVIQGPVSKVGWMFRENIFPSVRSHFSPVLSLRM
jgi:hypothetical protein